MRAPEGALVILESIEAPNYAVAGSLLACTKSSAGADGMWLSRSTLHDLAMRVQSGRMMDELNGRMIACQLLITGLIARVANNSPDPLRFLTDFRDEIKAVASGINIAGMDNTDRVRQSAQKTIDELFSLMKPPSID
jgi:hypothetical protein